MFLRTNRSAVRGYFHRSGSSSADSLTSVGREFATEATLKDPQDNRDAPSTRARSTAERELDATVRLANSRSFPSGAALDEETAQTAVGVAPITDVAQNEAKDDGFDAKVDDKSSTWRSFAAMDQELSPEEAMRGEERARIRAECITGMVGGLSAALAIFVMSPDPGHGDLGVVAGILLALTYLVLMWRTRADECFEGPFVEACLLLTVPCMLCIVYVFGIYSAAWLPVALFIYFRALMSKRHAYLCLAQILIFIITIATFEAVGILTPTGAAPLATPSISVVLCCASMIILMVITLFSLSRSARRASHEAFAKLRDATAALALRDALLAEARRDFARAIRTGNMGRFSGSIVGSYRLTDVLGRGAMGEVYEGTHVQSGELAAVKVLQIEATRLPGLIKRFRREAELVNSINSPYVVKLYEVSTLNAEVPYIAMEKLTGRDLRAILAETPTLPHDDIEAMVSAVAQALDGAASVGIVHRDIKPGNIFRTSDGQWKVVDFGISMVQGSSSTLTAGHIVGTPGYMAPEQAQGKPVDHRADLYALAMVVYRAMTGRTAFQGRDFHEILLQIVGLKPENPSFYADVPPEIDTVLQVGLAKNPELRFGSGAELAQAVREAFAGTLSDKTRARAAKLALDE